MDWLGTGRAFSCPVETCKVSSWLTNARSGLAGWSMGLLESFQRLVADMQSTGKYLLDTSSVRLGLFRVRHGLPTGCPKPHRGLLGPEMSACWLVFLENHHLSVPDLAPAASQQRIGTPIPGSWQRQRQKPGAPGGFLPILIDGMAFPKTLLFNEIRQIPWAGWPVGNRVSRCGPAGEDTQGGGYPSCAS